MGQRLFHLVNQHQAEVPGLQARQRTVNGRELANDLLDVPGARGAFQALAQQRHDLAGRAAALAGVFVEDDLVEGGAKDLGLDADVLVTTVAGTADDDAAPVGRQRGDGAHQGLHGCRHWA